MSLEGRNSLREEPRSEHAASHDDDAWSIASLPRLKSWCGSENLKALWGLFLLNTSFAILQLAGAFVANSLSMFSDSGSMLVDSLAYFANITLERRKHLLGAKATKFWEVVTSVASVSLLVGVTIYAIIDAARRLADPTEAENEEEAKNVDGRLVFAFACGNFVLDVVMCGNYFYQMRSRKAERTLRDQILHEAHDELNMISAFVHLFADSLRTLTSLVAGVLEAKYKDDATDIDSYAAFGVCGTILLAASFVLYEAFYQFIDYRNHPYEEASDDNDQSDAYRQLT